MTNKRYTPIRCETPCRDEGLYACCRSDNWNLCNILNGKAVNYSDGTPVQGPVIEEGPLFIGAICDEGLIKRLNEGSGDGRTM